MDQSSALTPLPLSDDEHHARAMLMGLVYFPTKGGPGIYYKPNDKGLFTLDSVLNAETLEPVIPNRNP